MSFKMYFFGTKKFFSYTCYTFCEVLVFTIFLILFYFLNNRHNKQKFLNPHLPKMFCAHLVFTDLPKTFSADQNESRPHLVIDISVLFKFKLELCPMRCWQKISFWVIFNFIFCIARYLIYRTGQTRDIFSDLVPSDPCFSNHFFFRLILFINWKE